MDELLPMVLAEFSRRFVRQPLPPPPEVRTQGSPTEIIHKPGSQSRTGGNGAREIEQYPNVRRSGPEKKEAHPASMPSGPPPSRRLRQAFNHEYEPFSGAQKRNDHAGERNTTCFDLRLSPDHANRSERGSSGTTKSTTREHGGPRVFPSRCFEQRKGWPKQP